MLPFFKAIFDNQPAAAIQLIMNNRAATTLEWRDHKALQIAAKEGCREIVLYLLQYGAHVDAAKDHQKTAFYYAVEYGHTLIAQILLACGASKEKALLLTQEHGQAELNDEISNIQVDAAIVCNILLWPGSKNNHPNNFLFNLVNPYLSLLSLDERAGIAELKAINIPKSLNLTQMTRLVGDATLCSKNRFTPGYWIISAAEKRYPVGMISLDTTGLAEVCHTDEQWKITLLQLRRFSRKSYNYLFENPSRVGKTIAQMRALESSLYDFEFLPEKQILSAEGQIIYHRLVRGTFSFSTPELLSITDKYQEYSEVAILAFQQKNFVALNRLHQKLDRIDHEVFLALFLHAHQSALALYWLICSGIEIADFLLNYPQEIDVINQLALLEKKKGIAYALVSSRLGVAVVVPRELRQLLTTLEQTKEQQVVLIQLALQSRYQLPAFSLTFDPVGYVRVAGDLSSSELEAISVYCYRFKLIVEMSGGKDNHSKTAKEVWQYAITPFLSIRERLKLSSVSHLYREVMNDPVGTDQQLSKIEMQIGVIKKFIALSEIEIARNANLNFAISLALITLVALAGIAWVAFMHLLLSAAISDAALVSLIISTEIVLVSIALAVPGIAYVENWVLLSLSRCSQAAQETAKDLFASFHQESNNRFRHFNLSSLVNEIILSAKAILLAKEKERVVLQQVKDKKQLVLNNNCMQRKAISYESSRPLPGLFALNAGRVVSNDASLPDARVVIPQLGMAM
jgi:hypothetical protein